MHVAPSKGLSGSQRHGIRGMIGLSKSWTILRAFNETLRRRRWGSEQAASCTVHVGSKPLQSTLLGTVAVK